MERETEAVVGEEGTRLEVLQNEGWSFTGVLYKEKATGKDIDEEFYYTKSGAYPGVLYKEGYCLRSRLRVLLYKEWSFCRVLYKEGY